MKLLANIIVGLIALPISAVQAAIFYVIVDSFMGFTVTWPLALAVGYATHVTWQQTLLNDLEDA